MADVDTSEVDQMIADLPLLGQRIKSGSRDEMENQMDQLADEIPANARNMGLVNENDTKPDQPDLSDKSSWAAVRNGPDSFSIRTTAPHAAAHQEGNPGGYSITPNGDPYLLSFEPENPSEWDSHPGDSTVQQDGHVYLPVVNHPGHDGTDYITAPVAEFFNKTPRKIGFSLGSAFKKSGFRYQF